MRADLEGRVALITGANSGIGYVAARELVARGMRVFVACRSRAKAERAFPELGSHGPATLRFLPLELGDLASVRRCAALFLETGLPLHLLINNAGLAGRGLSASGFELNFGVNHVGHFLLTQLLLDRLKESAPARVVTVASRAHRRVISPQLEHARRPTRSLTGIREYQVSKLANVLFSAELGRRLAGSGVTSYSLHPGVVDTPFWRAVPAPLRPLLRLRRMISPEAGARTLLYCATADGLHEQTGRYYADSQPTAPSLTAQDHALAALLWEQSNIWTQSPAVSADWPQDSRSRGSAHADP
jgi:retinol dehydrogenase-12